MRPRPSPLRLGIVALFILHFSILLSNPFFISGCIGFLLAFIAQQPAHSQIQDASVVFEKARSITVRIEAATLGSGVLVRRDGDRYTVLTAWHVVKGQRPGEEMAITTPDGVQHKLVQDTIRRLGNVDLALLEFKSSQTYPIALLGSVNGLKIGSNVYVFGFETTVAGGPQRGRAESGILKADPLVFAQDGYQLLYSAFTLPGMSGGPVLNGAGELIGIHGRAETDVHVAEVEGKSVSTGTNMGIPINYYLSLSLAQLPGSPISPRIPDPSPSSGSTARTDRVDQDSPFPRIGADSVSRQLGFGGPATPGQMSLYTRIAAINTCIYRGRGVDFDKSVGIAGETMTQILIGQHKGLIQQVGPTPLTIEQLRKGAINSAVIGAYEICPKQVPANISDRVRSALMGERK